MYRDSVENLFVDIEAETVNTAKFCLGLICRTSLFLLVFKFSSGGRRKKEKKLISLPSPSFSLQINGRLYQRRSYLCARYAHAYPEKVVHKKDIK